MLALMTKTKLTNDQWRHVHPLLPSPRKGRGRPSLSLLLRPGPFHIDLGSLDVLVA